MSTVILPIIAILLSVAACVTDLRTGRIPNWLTLPVVGISPVLFAILQGRIGAVLSLFGLVLSGAVPWLLYRSTQGRGIGGGDVKLFAALGALLGPTRGLEIQLTAFGLLALFAFIVLAYRGQLLRLIGNTLRLAASPFIPRNRRQPIEAASLTEIRMGPSIALAVVANSALAYLHGFVPWLG